MALGSLGNIRKKSQVAEQWQSSQAADVCLLNQTSPETLWVTYSEVQIRRMSDRQDQRKSRGEAEHYFTT